MGAAGRARTTHAADRREHHAERIKGLQTAKAVRLISHKGNRYSNSWTVEKNGASKSKLFHVGYVRVWIKVCHGWVRDDKS
jgi:hypothetical protein